MESVVIFFLLLAFESKYTHRVIGVGRSLLVGALHLLLGGGEWSLGEGGLAWEEGMLEMGDRKFMVLLEDEQSHLIISHVCL